MNCSHCKLPVGHYDEHHRYCPNCGTLVVLPDVEWNMFSPWRGVYATCYGGMLPFDREAIIEAEKNHRSYGERESWLGSYKPDETEGMTAYTAIFKIRTWEKISYDVEGNMVLTPEEPPVEGVKVTYRE